MKTKILTRIFAAFIAASTAIATPGIVSANGDGNGIPKKEEKKSHNQGDEEKNSDEENDLLKKKRKRSRNQNNSNESYNEEEELEAGEEGYSFNNSFSDDENSSRKKDLSLYLPKMSLLFDSEDEFEIMSKVKHFVTGHIFVQGCDEDMLTLIISQLSNCSKTEGLEFDVVSTIRKMTANNYLERAKRKSIGNLICILRNCVFNNNMVSRDVIEVLNLFKYEGLLNGLDHYHVCVFIDALNNCSQTVDAQENVSKLLKNIPLNELEEKDIDVVIDTLNQCLQNTNAQVNISKLLKKIPLNKLSKEHIVTILAILDQCSKTDKARANTAWAIRQFAKKVSSNELDKEHIGVLLDALMECSKNGKISRQNIAHILEEFIQSNIWQKCEKQQISLLWTLLIDCLNNKRAQSSGYFALYLLSNKLSEYAHDENASPKIKEAAIELIDKLMHFVNKCSMDWHISYTISKFSTSGLLNDLSNDKILEIINFLKSLAGDKDSKEFVASSIAGLAANHMLDSFKGQPEKLSSLLNILYECFYFDNSNTQNSRHNDINFKVANSIIHFLIENVKPSKEIKKSVSSSFYCRLTKEDRQKFCNQLVENSWLKDLPKEEKEKFKERLIEFIFCASIIY